MYKLILFAGTTEGRLLAEYCAQKKIPALVSVVSDYGKALLPDSPYLTIRFGPLDRGGMEELFLKEQAKLVIDATHPYAVQATKNIKTACSKAGCAYIRCLRESQETKRKENVLYFSTLEESAAFLKGTEGNILLTTGSKEISAFTAIENRLDRLYVRVLPMKAVVESCEALGIVGKHLICMQGPFTHDMNAATIKQFHISYLVTKEAGRAGGYEEKLSAAAACGIPTIVIGRPSKEEGMELLEVKKMLRALESEPLPFVSLVGIGMGGKGQITIEAVQTLKECDIVLGARRMIESVSWLIGKKKRAYGYLPEEILGFLEQDTRWRHAAVLFSGDTGFYSGALGLSKALSKKGYSYRIIPGISSVSYLSAVFGVSWEDACLRSLHGRDLDVIAELKKYKKLFLLLGGRDSVSDLCRKLTEAGYGDLKVKVGERLSYPEERLTDGTARELKEKEFHSLSVVYMEQEIEETA